MPEQPRARQLPARRAQRRQQVLARLLSHRRLAAFHRERRQNLGFWKQLTLHQKGVTEEEWSGAPELRVGVARPLLQGKQHGRAQLPQQQVVHSGDPAPQQRDQRSAAPNSASDMNKGKPGVC